MTEQHIPEIVNLSDTDLKLASSDEDIRGRTVVDKTGEDIGDVKDLLVDKDGSKVRFLRIGSAASSALARTPFSSRSTPLPASTTTKSTSIVPANTS